MFPPAFFIFGVAVGSKRSPKLTMGVAASAHPTPSENAGVLTQTDGAGASRLARTRASLVAERCATHGYRLWEVLESSKEDFSSA